MSDKDKTIKKKDTVEKEEPERTGNEKTEKYEKETKDVEKEPSITKSKSWQKSVENFFLFWN